jgi:hypothetical protein
MVCLGRGEAPTGLIGLAASGSISSNRSRKHRDTPRRRVRDRRSDRPHALSAIFRRRDAFRAVEGWRPQSRPDRPFDDDAAVMLRAIWAASESDSIAATFRRPATRMPKESAGHDITGQSPPEDTMNISAPAKSMSLDFGW